MSDKQNEMEDREPCKDLELRNVSVDDLKQLLRTVIQDYEGNKEKLQQSIPDWKSQLNNVLTETFEEMKQLEESNEAQFKEMLQNKMQEIMADFGEIEKIEPEIQSFAQKINDITRILRE